MKTDMKLVLKEHKMNRIKFSHKYYKMPYMADNKTKLVQMFIEHSDNFSKEFIEYDTKIRPEGYYKLPKNKYIVLLFLNEITALPSGKPYSKDIEFVGYNLWTTIRRWTPQKEKYYRERIGQEFEVIVNEI